MCKIPSVLSASITPSNGSDRLSILVCCCDGVGVAARNSVRTSLGKRLVTACQVHCAASPALSAAQRLPCLVWRNSGSPSSKYPPKESPPGPPDPRVFQMFRPCQDKEFLPWYLMRNSRAPRFARRDCLQVCSVAIVPFSVVVSRAEVLRLDLLHRCAILLSGSSADPQAADMHRCGCALPFSALSTVAEPLRPAFACSRAMAVSSAIVQGRPGSRYVRPSSPLKIDCNCNRATTPLFPSAQSSWLLRSRGSVPYHFLMSGLQVGQVRSS